MIPIVDTKNFVPAHRNHDLRQMASLPLDAKIRMSLERIRAWYEHWDGQVYVAFSGGKDSTVLKHLVESLYPDTPSVFINTGLEYPELRRHALAQRNVVRIDPTMRFDEVIERYGWPVVSKEQASYVYEVRHTRSWKNYDARMCDDSRENRFRLSKRWRYLLDAPFKISSECCHVMKKAPAMRYEKETGRHPMLGVRALEGGPRARLWLRDGCNAFRLTRPHSWPIAFWTDQDVLEYLIREKLGLPSVYGDIIRDEDGTLRTTKLARTGCIFCAFGAYAEPSPNRFERLKQSHPKQWDYVMNRLGMGAVLDYMGTPKG